MTRLLKTTFVVLLAQSCVSAQAQEDIDWKKQLAGLDGVSISCMRNIKRKYANRVCDGLMKHAAEKLKDGEIPHETVGTAYDRGFAPGQPSELKTPLNLTFHVRATKPGPLGMDVRMSASVSYTAAIQAESETTPRRGELLMWQNGVTSSATGGTRKLERAVLKFSKKRMEGILTLIDEHWSR